MTDIALPLAPVRRQTPPGRVGLRQSMAAEWTKLWSVRSTMWTLVATVIAVLGLCVLGTATIRPDEVIGDPTRRTLVGFFLGQLIFGVLGVLVMSAEYGTGTIRATLAAIPRRPVVLGAKIAVFGAVAIVVSEILAFCAFFIGQAILSTKHGTGFILPGGFKVSPGIAHLISSNSASLSQPGVLRAVVGSGLYLAALGLLALGLATIIRHTAGAISAFVGVVLVVPIIVEALPNSIHDAVARYLPASIGMVMFSTRGVHDFSGPAFSPWAGMAILAGYVVAVLGIGCWLLVKRDA